MQYRILRESEYEKNKYILPNPGRRFWIESESELGTKKCGFVNDEGVLDKKGAYCSDTSFWLRPVIEFDKDEQRDIVFTEGQQVYLYSLEWTAISEDVLVCDRCVEDVKFDDNETSFENSYLKYALYQYMKRRSSEEAFKAPASKSDNSSDITELDVDESEFSYSFLSNVLCIFLAAAAGIVCTLSFSPISISMFAIVVVAMSFILGKYNVKKIKEGIINTKKKYREKMVADQSPKITAKDGKVSVYGLTYDQKAGSGKTAKDGTTDAFTVKGEYALDTEGLSDEEVIAKTSEINKLLEAIMKTGNRTAQSKVKFFYLPETQKTLQLYDTLSENGIETQNTKECMQIISENLDKTIRLLKIEYDKATDDTLLEARLSSGVIGKMLSDAENQESNKIQLG